MDRRHCWPKCLSLCLLLGVAALTGCSDRAQVAPEELAFRSARSLAQAIRAGETTAMDLLELYLDRVGRLDPGINAIVALDAGNARARAKEADESLARGEVWGPLHGLPITVKDSFGVVGMPTTGGIPEFADFMAKTNAVPVQRLIDAGAVVFGKTNLPYLAGDWQSYNEIYGTTNNPWDLARTPGGSSGGAAAALAAGLTAFELGSDIGGSIRIPAHYTGVYGHKPTFGIVPRDQFPMFEAVGVVLPPDGLSVAGPMARSAEDLALLLEVLVSGGGDDGETVTLDPPRAERLQDYRVAAWLDDPRLEVDEELRNVLASLIDTLRGAGVTVDEAARPDVTLARNFGVYLPILLGITSSFPTPPELFNEQEQIRAKWVTFFEDHDVVLCPAAQTVAIPHDHSSPDDFTQRRITVNGRPWLYTDQSVWISLATLAGLPATTAPVGFAASGLPVGVQILGPHLGDRTTIDFARRLEDLVGGFEIPPGFQ